MINPITLEGKIVNLVPLAIEHAGDLTLSGNDPSIWLYMRYGFVDSEPKMLEFIQSFFDNTSTRKSVGTPRANLVLALCGSREIMKRVRERITTF
jgi:hypothetical protein